MDKHINPCVTYGLKLPPYFDKSHMCHISQTVNKFDRCSFLTCCNSIGNGMYIDIHSKKKVIKPNDGFGGVGGTYLLPTALANVNYFHTHTNKKIIGCGGINSGETALMHIYAGSSELQVGTHLHENGIDVFNNIRKEVGEVNENMIGCVTFR